MNKGTDDLKFYIGLIWASEKDWKSSNKVLTLGTELYFKTEYLTAFSPTSESTQPEED